jgi:hypothetical protein
LSSKSFSAFSLRFQQHFCKNKGFTNLRKAPNKKSIREEVRAQLREQGSLGVEDPEVFAAVFRALGNHPAYLDRDLDDPMLWDDWRRRSIDVPKKAFHVVRFVVADAVELVITIMPENVQTETVDRGLFANMKSS